MTKLDKSQYIGITESGDPSFHLEIFDNLYDGNIIITKRLTDKLIDKLIENKHKIILHCTVTGYGGTKVEPFVPDYVTFGKKLQELLDKGFPIEHVVLRVDPIIPTDKGICLALKVMEYFSNLVGVKRVRFSFLDMYDHVKKRFAESDFPIPYEDFHAPIDIRYNIVGRISDLAASCGFDIEVCGEPGIDSCSCLSQKDIDILGLTDKIMLIGEKGQRQSCHCPSNKRELIKGKPERCENKCVYCFWRN